MQPAVDGASAAREQLRPVWKSQTKLPPALAGSLQAVVFVWVQESKVELGDAEPEGTVPGRMGGHRRVGCCEYWLALLRNGSFFFPGILTSFPSSLRVTGN